MTTILFAFGLSLLLSLVLTPFSRWVGIRFGAMDYPDGRKVHAVPIPRTGGMGIVLSVLLVILLGVVWKTEITELFLKESRDKFFMLGALLAFGIGFVDDFHRLRPSVKFLFQVAAATLAYYGGLQVMRVWMMDSLAVSVAVGYLLTVFWFVIMINAVNLVDGMDGLAGGIVVFACLVITILNTMRNEYLTAMLFATLGGATLGFLRYNFKPASIFLGDGGSYFLGYCIAGLSILSSSKAQMSAVILIPVLSLGIPLFDTLIAPLRRFVRGKKMFSPDRQHIHHKLSQLGLNTRNVVLVLYGITFGLCVLALIVVNLRDEQAGLFLVLLGIGAFFFVRKLGYFEYFASDKVFGWLRDISDVAGLTHERRSFLNVQMDLAASKDFESLWGNCTIGFDMLGFDFAEMSLDSRGEGREERKLACDGDGFLWCRNGFNREKHFYEESLLKLELPLLNDAGVNVGILWLVKNLRREPVSHYTLRRIEHLRRTLTAALDRLCGGGGA